MTAVLLLRMAPRAEGILPPSVKVRDPFVNQLYYLFYLHPINLCAGSGQETYPIQEGWDDGDLPIRIETPDLPLRGWRH